MMASTPARAALRDLLNSREIVLAPGVFDGISAQLVRRTGHVAAYLTGAGVAASGFGLPDIGLVTASEMAERVRMIVGSLEDLGQQGPDWPRFRLATSSSSMST
jgi:2-methylisocitrate lyase-like PEP mutase family enzyme